MRNTTTTTATASRLRDDDELIELDEGRQLMGGMSVSTAYADPEFRALFINMSPDGRRNHRVRLVKRKVLELRAKRVARAETDAARVRAQVEARVERRRAKSKRTRAEARTET